MKKARFTSDVPSPPSSAQPLPPFARTETGLDSIRSRSPSIAGTDDEDGDYDWSGEEDLVDEEAKFEQNMGVAKKQRWGFRKFLAVAFGSLIGSTIISGLLVTPALLVHFFWFKPQPTEYRRYVKDNVEAWLFWAGVNTSISWYLALIVDLLPTVVRFIVGGFWGHVSEGFKTKIEMYNSVKNTIKPLLYAASAWASWVIIFAHIYQLYDQNDGSKSRAYYTSIVYDIIEFFFFFTLVICAQRMLSQAIAFSFHRTAYKERLASVHETLKVVETLRAYRPKRSHIKQSSQGFGSRSFNALNFATSALYSRPESPVHSRNNSNSATPSRPGTPVATPKFADVFLAGDPDATLVGSKGKGKGQSDIIFSPSPQRVEPVPITSLGHFSGTDNSSPHQYPPSFGARPHDDSDSDDPLHVKQAAVAVAKTVKTAVLHDARNIEGKETSELGGLMWDVSTAHEAKKLARGIYNTFRRGTRTYLIPSDFYPAFPTEEESEKAFRVLDNDNNGDLSRAEIKTALMKVYKERRSLSRSMRDVSVALKSLDQILLFFALVILFFISLSVFNVNVGDSLTSMYSLGIGLSFIFKNAASNCFDAIMFLFVTHPFDTGDRCFIDDENLVVKKMNLFATVFTRSDGTESYYFNSQLFNKFITNARRSDKTAENLTMQIDWTTPLDKIDALEACLNRWLETEKNRWYQPNTAIMLQNIKYMRHLECTIGILHNGNWQDWGLHNARRTTFHAAVNYYCRQLGISNYSPVQPVQWTKSHELSNYRDDEEYMDTSFDMDELSPMPSHQQLPNNQAPKKEACVSASLGFHPPPDKPVPGMRARKSKLGKKAVVRSVGADG
ncbi:Mechanosensitive ion channel-domain-containing protein [Irpex rosettiformis]|uniref:Mechanosensitive ion channel-domain-containing protein n=1 Tax=Irpex rosettiformis TaxID=378272 RepID=A0ACB8UBY1_9APHY|nr:Mechanosensitive ion channel-domain-containing protein [Irpex rosettiformis]